MRTYGIGGSCWACVQSLDAQSEACVLVGGGLTLQLSHLMLS